MSTIADFNRIEDCDKIDAHCVDGFSDLTLDDDGSLCSITSWGESCIDLAEAVKKFESCTTMYLSPENNPNCLVYEPEENCGDNICIHGDDLSRIISMTKLKDVDQGQNIGDGNVYMYDGSTGKFEPYDLKTVINNINATLQSLSAAISNLGNRVSVLETTVADHGNRLNVIEEKLTPPADAPSNVKVVFGNINDYSDPNVQIDEGSGTVTSLDKTHGLYTHTLASNAYGDELFG